MAISKLRVYFVVMYFKVSMRTNPETGIYSGYYRLVESYRNNENRVCHRTILNAGFLDELTTDQLNLIQKILTIKATNHDQPLFELPFTDDPTVLHYVDKFYNRMVAEKRIDVLVENQEKKALKSGKDLQTIDINSIRNKDVREIGAESVDSLDALCNEGNTTVDYAWKFKRNEFGHKRRILLSHKVLHQ